MQASQQVAPGIEKGIVVNARRFAKDPPALSLEESLRRPPLNVVAQRLPLLVGGGKIGRIQPEQQAAQHQRQHQHRRRNAVEADASAFDRHHFIALAQQGQLHQHGQQERQRRHPVDYLRRLIPNQPTHHRPGNLARGDVVHHLQDTKQVK